jgi:hypothetical protein
MNGALTAGLTVFAGFVVFVGGQIVQRFILEPIQEQRRVIGEIASALLYHDNVGRYTMRDTRESEAWVDRDGIAANLRKLAGELRKTRATIPAYSVLEQTPWVPRTENVMKASKGLVGWSNAVLEASEGTSTEHKDTIARSLGILR